jgi:hypothetical protein
MSHMIFSALVRAWLTTSAATSLFVAAIALSRVWDSAIFLRALQRALTPEM